MAGAPPPPNTTEPTAEETKAGFWEGAEEDTDYDDDIDLNDSQDASMQRTVPLRGFAEFLVHDVQREYTNRSMCLFIFVVIFFTVSAALSLPLCAENPEEYFVTHTVEKDILLADTFKEIRTPEAFYAYLRQVKDLLFVPAANFVAGSPVLQTHSQTTGHFGERQNIPIEYLVIRQQRVQSEPCGDRAEAKPIPPVYWQKAKQTCYPGHGSERLVGTGYRTGGAAPFVAQTTDPFLSDSVKTNVPDLVYATGEFRGYTDSNEQFTLLLPFQDLTREDVEAVIADLETNGWIDFSTRMVSVLGVFYNPQSALHQPYGLYTAGRMVLEFHYSGSPFTSVWLRPFKLMLLDEFLDTFVFTIDILLLLYVPFLIRDCAWHFYINYMFQPWCGYVGLVDILNVLHMIVLFVALVYRFMIWADSDKMGTQVLAQDFFNTIMGYQQKYETGRLWYIAALWITWVRVIEYLRYNARLNAVTETVKLASTDLFSLLMVTAIILFTFALVGNAVYGRHVDDFKTLGNAMFFITRTVFTADIEGANYAYSAMVELEPYWTPLFVLLYFGLSWLILLNVVLGILATGFSAASQSTRDRSWDFNNLKDESCYFMKKRCWCCCGVGRIGCCEYINPFSSGYFERRAQASQKLLQVMAELDLAYLQTPDGQKGKPYDGNSVRKSKYEFLQYATQPEWGMRMGETSRAFDECLAWWRGSLSDIASQQQGEKEQLRNSINDVTMRMAKLSAETEDRFYSLDAKLNEHTRVIVDGVRGNNATLHGRHDRAERTLDQLLLRRDNSGRTLESSVRAGDFFDL